MTKSDSYISAYTLIRNILEMLQEDTQVAVTKGVVQQVVSLMPKLQELLPDNGQIQFYFSRIAPAFEVFKDAPDVIPNDMKMLLVGAFASLRQQLAEYLYTYLNENSFELTNPRIPILRSVVSVVNLGEEVD